MIATLLAVAKTKLSAKPSSWDPSLLWTTLALVAIIVIGAIAFAVLNLWRKRALPPTFDANDQLAQFRELYDKGELSEQEFERIREQLGGKIRADMGVPASAAAKDEKAEQSHADGQAAAPGPNGSKRDVPGDRGAPPIQG
jgi:Short C-terminal domain